jgi:hypothetical protein
MSPPGGDRYSFAFWLTCSSGCGGQWLVFVPMRPSKEKHVIGLRGLRAHDIQWFEGWAIKEVDFWCAAALLFFIIAMK